MRCVPFPQANNIELIFSILKDVGDRGLSKSDVSSKYKMNTRQGAYYLNALWYLGFVEKINSKYFLTQKGINVRLASNDDMKRKFIRETINHPIIEILYMESVNMNKEQKHAFISSRLYNEFSIANSTAKRRASSIVAWFEWFDNNIR